jgi:SAM-dependent methyltransferase
MPDALDLPEVFHPLHVRVCDSCYLVQLPDHVNPAEIFEEYAYFSSNSTSWLRHASDYADEMVDTLRLGPDSLVAEVASNDGYLLANFVEKGIPVIGIEPARNVAAVAQERGVDSHVAFFGAETAAEVRAMRGQADLIAANNMFAHVPDLHDIAEGFRVLLAPQGVLTVEFHYLPRLIEQNQFDTIYHEHYTYLSLHTSRRILADHGLEVFDVRELRSHGGSLRVFARHAGSGEAPSPRVAEMLERELTAGYMTPEPYIAFGERVAATKRALLTYLIEAREAGRRVAGYGAPGKSITLLNYCGIGTDLLEFTVDRNPYKQGTYMPGVRIPVLPTEALAERRPDDILILPWNLEKEIAEQLAYTSEWGARLVVPIPRPVVIAGGDR